MSKTRCKIVAGTNKVVQSMSPVSTILSSRKGNKNRIREIRRPRQRKGERVKEERLYNYNSHCNTTTTATATRNMQHQHVKAAAAAPDAILGFSVLHCHGVFLSGDQQQQQQQQKPLQQQEEKVAKIHIHSSSKRKK